MCVHEMAQILLSASADTDKITSILKASHNFSGGFLENENIVLIWADHIRSFPLFYVVQNQKLSVSPSAYTLKDTCKITKPSQTAMIQFAMSGYVVGGETLYHELMCVQPGEYLIFDKKKKEIQTIRYFNYSPNFAGKKTQEEYEQELGNLLDTFTKEIIDRAKGKTIWVPLSAGLDSRILLCKLHEHNYPNIQTFTYGPSLNFEAIHAKRIAKKLNLSWRMITLSEKDLKKAFKSQRRKEFWRFADNLKSIPCMREYSAIQWLYDQNLAKQGDIFMNGQSGDYISGGHIPFDKSGNLPSPENLTKLIIDKHYDLWKSLKTQNNLKTIIDTAIKPLISDDIASKRNSLDTAKQSEMWEYDGRQICYVVNGQRVYEFFGYDWEMPLWDKRLVDFFQDVPLELKKDQSLYKSYLKNYNYMDLFPEKEPNIWRWPIKMFWVLPVAQLIHALKGRQAKDRFYAKMRRHGHYANQFQFFPRALHKRTYLNSRNVISLYIPIWFNENTEISYQEVTDLFDFDQG